MHSQAELRSLICCDAATGVISRHDGRICDGTNSGGYIQLNVGGKFYYGHRLAWLYMWLSGPITSGAEDYDPDFVASIHRADRATPEARFNNVVDMLNWLNRD